MRKRIQDPSVRDGLFFLLLGAALGVHSAVKFHGIRQKTPWIMSPYLFPLLLAALAVALSLCLIRQGAGGAARGKGADDMPAPPAQTEPFRAADVLLVILLSAGALLLMRLVGFLPAAAAYLAAMMLRFGERRWKVVLSVAVLVPLAIVAVFQFGLSVRLP